MDVSQRITNILNYYRNNPGCDPNMHEFVRLCYDMVQYLHQNAPDYGIHNVRGPLFTDGDNNPTTRAVAVYEKFKILSKQFEQKLLGNNLGITKDSPLYLLYQDVSRGVGTYSAYYDTPLREKLGGVALFIAQEKRAVAKGLISDFTYDNEYEMEEILRLSQEFHDPQTSGYYVKAPSEKEATYVAHQPSPRQLLLEEIMNEFKKRSKTR